MSYHRESIHHFGIPFRSVYTGSLGFLGQTNNQLSASIQHCIHNIVATTNSFPSIKIFCCFFRCVCACVDNIVTEIRLCMQFQALNKHRNTHSYAFTISWRVLNFEWKFNLSLRKQNKQNVVVILISGEMPFIHRMCVRWFMCYNGSKRYRFSLLCKSTIEIVL